MQSMRFDDYEEVTDDDPFSTKVMSFEVNLLGYPYIHLLLSFYCNDFNEKNSK